ncbi:MAG: 30S ribosomal protein S17e [Candidatus Micrarchaeia archaeon]
MSRNIAMALAKDFVKMNSEFSTDFSKNKEILKKMRLPLSKYQINKIAAKIVKLAKRMAK